MFKFFKKKEMLQAEGKLKIDIGNSSIKINDGQEIKTFLNSIMEVNKSLARNKNIMKYKHKYYLVGGKGTTNNYETKKEIPNIDLIILYATQLYSYKKVDIDILLPLNQIEDISYFKNKLANRSFNINDKDLYIGKVELKIEGEEILPVIKKDEGYNTIIDLGFGTTEIFIYNSQDYLVENMSFNIGSRNILGRVLGSTKALTLGILNDWLNNKYKFTREQQKVFNKSSDYIIQELKTILDITVFNVIPPNSTIHFVGGTSILCKRTLAREFKEYKCKFYSSKISKNCNVIYFEKVQALTKEERREIIKNNIDMQPKELSSKFHLNYNDVRNDLYKIRKELNKK